MPRMLWKVAFLCIACSVDGRRATRQGMLDKRAEPRYYAEKHGAVHGSAQRLPTSIA